MRSLPERSERCNNGNLLADHTGTEYNYDAANRLIEVAQGGNTYTFAYNGLGDRLQQTVNEAEVTNYTLDLAAGLTQVLDDGTNSYLYGLGRIGEDSPAGWAYHLPDALGSVRQLADGNGAVVLAQSYQPYGQVLSSEGAGSSAYGYTGEWTDDTGLVFLRARYLDTGVGRFLTRDPWGGDLERPITLQPYHYVGQNPINRVDPSGLLYCSAPEPGCAQWVLDALDAIEKAGPRGNQLVQALLAKDADLKLLQYAQGACYYAPPHIGRDMPPPSTMPGSGPQALP